jgi:hypothetical protein
MLNLYVYVTKVFHGAGNGFSATDVDMYFDVIAEAAEDDLRAILQEEGLPLPPVRTQSRFEAHDVHAYSTFAYASNRGKLATSLNPPI